MFKVSNRNPRTTSEICSRRFVVFIVNLEHISHLVLVFLLLTGINNVSNAIIANFPTDLN